MEEDPIYLWMKLNSFWKGFYIEFRQSFGKEILSYDEHFKS